jgi:two-component system response regulator
MLVISRSANSAIRIGDNIRIKVLSLHQRRVTIGIDAPPTVQVCREEVAPAIESEEPAASDLRVLVVEDSPVHAMLMERILARKGIASVVRTTFGEDAIRFIQLVQEDVAVKPDLVLLDLNLPGVSGKQVLEVIKSHPFTRSIPVVIISAHDDTDKVNECMACGANAFVSKADDFQEFRRSLLRTTEFWAHARLAC